MSAKDRINLLNEDAKGLIEGHDKVEEYFRNFDEGELTPEQRKHLIEMGIDPDAR
jgi:hypothetical protein